MMWQKSFKRCGISCSLLLTVVSLACWQTPLCLAGSPPTPDDPDLEIVVLQGEDGVNIIKNKTAVKPVVEVRHKNYLPGVGVLGGGIAGVTLYFSLEGGGAAKFANGQTSMSVVTDAKGQAVAGNLRPVHPGPVDIKIVASYQGQTVTRNITQTNFKTIAAAHKAGKIPGSSHGDPGTEMANQSTPNPAAQAGANALASGGSHALLIAGIAGGVAAAGGAVALTQLNSNSSSSSCPTQAQVDQLETALSNAENVCLNGTATYSQCQPADQAVLNALGALCSCAGVDLSQFQSALTQLGLSLPSACE